MSTLADYLKLHFLVLIAGVTGVLGELISLPAPAITFWRTLVAAVVLGGVVLWRKPPAAGRKTVGLLLANGFLIGVHWVSFFWAIQLSNVSVCMVGMATSTLWAAVLEPLVVRERRFRVADLLLGVVVVVAMGFLFGTGFKFALGLAVAIASAGVAIVFTIVNSRFTGRYPAATITFWEMVGAASVSAAMLPFVPWSVPSPTDVVCLLALALVCTVYAFTALTVLLRRVSVFAVALAYQLEPLYGILLATFFFAAAVPVLVSTVVHPWWTRRRAVAKALAMAEAPN
jgi:drug/metabolite transporter (DMT)-like permease